MAEYLLPDVGEGLTEAEIVAWKVQVGDVVKVNDVVVEIETAKSIVELPSPYAGEVTAVLVAEGDTVEVGMPIIAIGDPAATGAAPEGPAPATTDPAAELDLSNPAATGGGDGEMLVGRSKEVSARRRPRKGSASPATTSGAVTQLQVQGAFAPGVNTTDVVEADEVTVPVDSARPEQLSSAQVRALAKPPVRKLAKDLGVDLATIAPTGDGGVITRADVEVASASTPAAPAAAVNAIVAQRETREPVKGVRKMMATAMVDSAFTAPHVTEWITVDVTEGIRFVEGLRSRREFRDIKVSPLLLLARAVLIAVKRTPHINSTWDAANAEVVTKHYVNLGIAAATPRGLVVPNVKDAESLTMVELAEALGELIDTARAGKTQPADMAGGTFTITNVGVFGVDAGTPIINPGESAILCFGATKRQPWVVGTGADERIEIRDVCTFALSFDHRHIDGEAGSRFLADVSGIMSNPANALLF